MPPFVRGGFYSGVLLLCVLNYCMNFALIEGV